MEGLNPAIVLARQQIDAIPADDPGRLSALLRVAIELAGRYFSTLVIEELDEAIRMFREAVILTPPGDPDRGTCLSNLGHALGHKFTATQQMVDLNETICVLWQAFEVAERPSTLSIVADNLGMRIGQRHDRTQAMEDLNEAINMSRVSVQATSPDRPDRSGRLHNFGNNLNKRYMISKDPLDLDEAIESLHEAVNICPPGHPHRAQFFTNLGNSMTDRYALTRKDDHLEEAIQMLRKGLQAAPPQSIRSIWLHNLDLRLAERYARSGDLADLEETTEIARQSLELTSEDDPERINRQQSLANRLFQKHDHTGAIEDLDKAVAMCKDIVCRTPFKSSHMAARLNNLGQGYARRYSRTYARGDLDLAIDTLRRSIGASQPGDTARGTYLSNLGNSLLKLYTRNRSLAVLEESLNFSQEAVNETPPNHPAMAERLANLSLRLKDKFLGTKNMADLDKAVRISQEAVEAAPSKHSVQCECFDTAGMLLRLRYVECRNTEDLEKAKNYFIKSLDVSNTAISLRIKAGRRFMSLPNIADDPRAYDVARSTIALIPLLAPRSLQNTDKQHLLAEAVGMASDAAAIALQAGKGAEAALQFLETGRGVIAGSSFEQRDISTLLRKHGNLAASFIALRDRLDKPAMQDVGSSIRPEAEDIDPTVLDEIERRQRWEAEQQLTTLLDEIRSLSGFEKFLLPPSDAEMRDAATHGPIVVLNVSSHRCDALMIEQSGIQSIPLRGVSRARIDHYSMQVESVETLMWLWDSIVHPVLVALDLTAPSPALDSDAEWPRIWWIPTGPLTKFPLHAAGDHLGRIGETTLDCVVSSYSASVRTIIHGRRQQHHPPKSGDGSARDLVAVSMSKTIGHHPLRHADREVEEVLSAVDPTVLRHKRPREYKDDVLAALADCKIFHFAGHGSTHPTDPLQSTLLLKDWQEDPLTVGSLLQTDFGAKPPFLAYLSACGTGQIRDDFSVDENIHLANACQLAGFRHVVGTLWRVDDELCVQIAKGVYEFIRCHGLGDESVSHGLHSALRKRRDQWVEEISDGDDETEARQGSQMAREAVLDGIPLRSPYWVPYVHFGI